MTEISRARSGWRVRATLAFVASAIALMLGVGATAADSAGRNPGGWTRYHAQSFTTAPGDLCDFRLRSTVRFDREYVRTTDFFPNGDPKLQQYSGPLVVRLTNLETDAKIQRDLSGRGVVSYRAEGSYDFRTQGPAAIGFHDGDSLDPGYYLLRGIHVVRFNADGSRELILDHGTEHDLCDDLG